MTQLRDRLNRFLNDHGYSGLVPEKHLVIYGPSRRPGTPWASAAFAWCCGHCGEHGTASARDAIKQKAEAHVPAHSGMTATYVESEA
jgi:hypothetical protein